MVITNKTIELLWDITKHCNLSCRHCAINATRIAKTVPWQETYRILCNLKSKREISLINLQGGEPLSYPFIEKLISFFCKSKIKYSINTNGLLIDGKMIEIFSEHAPESIIFSFESFNAQQFNALKNSWLFPQLIENIKKVISIKNNIGVSVEGICVITTININSIPKIIESANELGFDILVLSKLCYSGRATVNNYLFPAPLQIYKMFSEILKYLSDVKFSTKILIPWATPRWLEHFGRNREVDAFYSQCNAVVKSNYINAEGIFLPCPKMRIILEFLKISEIEYKRTCDLKKNSLDVILESPLIEYIYNNFFKNPKLVPPICKTCKHFEYCQTCPANYVAGDSLVNDTADYKLCEFIQSLN